MTSIDKQIDVGLGLSHLLSPVRRKVKVPMCTLQHHPVRELAYVRERGLVVGVRSADLDHWDDRNSRRPEPREHLIEICRTSTKIVIKRAIKEAPPAVPRGCHPSNEVSWWPLAQAEDRGNPVLLFFAQVKQCDGLSGLSLE
ncbi:hypothetical protein RX329_41625 [Bradyrhizobium sp. BWC-3-1]|nr:hypothetical protein [Bradyrhizobium sp. BWC-3-1]WOH58515.1 hypothetical protein RX329_41625 [Bradyrhizobium sp. BWC-3-1]